MARTLLSSDKLQRFLAWDVTLRFGRAEPPSRFRSYSVRCSGEKEGGEVLGQNLEGARGRHISAVLPELHSKLTCRRYPTILP